MDKYNILGIAHARTNRKDNIFMQRQLYIVNYTWRWTYSAVQYFWYLRSLRWIFLRRSLYLWQHKYNSRQVGPTPESNSNFKCILGPKRFRVKKSVGFQIILVPKKFWVKNSVSTKIILVPKKMGSKKFCVKNSSQKKILGQK